MTNFWDDLAADLADIDSPEQDADLEGSGLSSGSPGPSEPSPERAVSYLDVTESTPLIDSTPRQRLRDLFTANNGRLHSEKGDLLRVMSAELGMPRDKLWTLLLDMRRRGLIDVVMVNKERVYTVALNGKGEAAEEKPLKRTPVKAMRAERPAPAPSVDVEEVDQERVNAALAEAMWLRYEHAMTQVGVLSQRVEELEAELAALKATPRSVAQRMLS